MKEDIFDYCLAKYNYIYKATKQQLEDEIIRSSRNHTVSATNLAIPGN